MKRTVTLATGVALASGMASVVHARPHGDGLQGLAPDGVGTSADYRHVDASEWRAFQRDGETIRMGERFTGQTARADGGQPYSIAIAYPLSVANELLSQAACNASVEAFAA